MDDDFIAQADAKLNSALDAGVLFRYVAPDNSYRTRLETTGAVNTVYPKKRLNGRATGRGRTRNWAWGPSPPRGREFSLPRETAGF